jgi:hypothetical protein
MHIVTHPGMAHRDELIAIALLLGFNDDFSVIERREPTTEELGDSDVWVIDIGLLNEPGFHNFDHHQYAPETNICAMTLVAGQLGIRGAMQQAFGWYDMTAVMDTQGPGGVAEYMNADQYAVTRLWANPVEAFLLERIGKCSRIDRWSENTRDLFLEIRYLGLSMLDYINKLKKRMEYLMENVQVVRGAGLPGMYLPRDPDVDPNPFGLDDYRREYCTEAAFCITPDDRGAGYSLYRYDDHPGLDFAKVGEDSRILFAHKGVFIAKTNDPLELDELLDVVNDAAVLVVK